MAMFTFQENRFVKGVRLGRKVLCATLSFAVLNASLAPVYGMSEKHRKNLFEHDPISEKNSKAPDRVTAQAVFEEDYEEAVSAQIPARKAESVSYGAWMLKGLENVADIAFAGSKGLLSLFSRGVSYALKNPGEALVAGLATQIAAIQAIRPITDEFLINQNTASAQRAPALARLSNENIFVAWEGAQTGNTDIYGRVLLPNGTAITDEFSITQNAGDQRFPSVATLNDGNIFVTWRDETLYDIYGSVVSPDGLSITNAFLINQNTTGPQWYPITKSLSNGNVLVLWQGDQSGNSDIYGRLFAINGSTPLTNDFMINQNTTGNQDNPALTKLNNGNVFIAWNGDQAGNLDVYGRVFASNGTALTGEFFLPQNLFLDQYNPSLLTLSNGNVLAMWGGRQTGDLDVYSRVFDPNGTPLTIDFRINQNRTGNQDSPSCALFGNGNVFVTWSGDQTGSRALYGCVLNANGTAILTGDFLINQNKSFTEAYPSLATLGNGNIFVAWGNSLDIYGKIFDPSDPILTTASFQTTGLPLLTTDNSQTTSKFLTTSRMQQEAQTTLLPTLLGVGGAVLGVSLGGSLLTACAIAGICGLKQYKNYKKKNPPKLVKERASQVDPFAPTANGFTEHPTFVGALEGRTYAIWKELSKHEAKRLQPLTAKEIPAFSSNLDKIPFFLGKGNFGATYAGSDVETGELFAIKEVYGRRAVDESLKEGKLQEKLKENPQIMGLVDYKSYEPKSDKYNPDDQPRLFQVMPLAYTNGGGYQHMISAFKETSQAEEMISDTFQQLMKGLSYMHSKEIYHLDIKADNILYMRDGSLRIGDFGRARDLGSDGQMTDYKMGDRRFFSPEQFAFIRHGLKQNGHQVVGQEKVLSEFPAWAADTWQGGLYILEILTQKDHPLSETTAPYETKLNSWTNATFETALKGITEIQGQSDKSFQGLLRGVLTVDFKSRLKPDAVVKALPPVILSPEKRALAFEAMVMKPVGEKTSPVKDLYEFETKEENKNYAYGTPPELLPGGKYFQGKASSDQQKGPYGKRGSASFGKPSGPTQVVPVGGFYNNQSNG